MIQLLQITTRETAGLMLAIGACVAVVGIINIYNHIQMGKPNIEEKIWNWVGGIIFLLLIETLIVVVLN